MSTRLPPRYLPTLTEVVDPSVFGDLSAGVADAKPTPAPENVPEVLVDFALPDAVPAQAMGAPPAAAPDRQALAQQLIKLVRPQLEAELRNLAMELFEAQFSALLPSLHLHIEEAVREALEQALPTPPDQTPI